MYKSFRLTAFTPHGRESQNCTLALWAWKDIYLSSYKTARMIFIYFAHFLTQIQGFYGKLQSVWLMKSKDVLKKKRHQRSPTVQTPTEGFNVGIVRWRCEYSRRLWPASAALDYFIHFTLRAAHNWPHPSHCKPVHSCGVRWAGFLPTPVALLLTLSQGQ